MKKISPYVLIMLINTISIGGLIACDYQAVFSEDQNSVRRRLFSEKRELAVIEEKQIEQQYDEAFSSLGAGWELFRRRDYDESYNHLFLSSINDNYNAQYLLGNFFEFGLGKIKRNLQHASALYTSVVLNSRNKFLIERSEKRIEEIIKAITTTSSMAQ